ncbi:hypothetical protein BJX64DRAFT_252237, partial [Aspergillus heterothallicus]
MLHTISTRKHRSSRRITLIINMAPPLAPSTRQMTYDIILSSDINASQMAEAASCHKGS